MLGAHARIFGRVNRASCPRDDGIEAFEQSQRRLPPEREVQCQRCPRPRETQQARRRQGAELLEHGQERAVAVIADHVEHLGQCIPRDVGRQHALMLQEPARAVQPVPVADAVERKKKRSIVRRRVAVARTRVPPAVEPARAETTDQGRRWREGNSGLEPGRWRGASGWRRDEIAAAENAAPPLPGGRQAIDPGDDMVECLRRGVAQREKIIEIPESTRLGGDPFARNARKRDLHPRDQSRQAQSADRCGEEVGMCCRRTRQSGAIAADQFEAAHMAPEAAGNMMVLAVHVVRDRAPDGDEARAGHDRQEPAVRHDQIQDVPEENARLASQHAGFPIEGDEAVQASRQQ